MAIVQADIVSRLSGGTTNTDPNLSLGGARSTAGGGVIVNDTTNNLFFTIGGAEGAAGSVKYRCFYFLNTHATLPLVAPKVWISILTGSPDDEIDIAIGSSAVNGTEQTVANEDTAPTGVTFTRPTTFASGLSTNDLPAGQHRAVWVKRTVNTNAAAFTGNTYEISIRGETAQ
jgi:hypothetical protein